MKEISTVRVNGNMIFKGHKLTIGVDLGAFTLRKLTADQTDLCQPGLSFLKKLGRRNPGKPERVPVQVPINA